MLLKPLQKKKKLKKIKGVCKEYYVYQPDSQELPQRLLIQHFSTATNIIFFFFYSRTLLYSNIPETPAYGV